MAAQDTVKIVMITGYLGAGKTTLLNHVLANEQGIRAAVIVNDIGEVNVDADLIAQAGSVMEMDDIIPLTNGCICCTLADDLAEQLTRIANSGDFDYIIIEASGICEPIPIAYTISTLCEGGADADADDDDAAGANGGAAAAGAARLALDNIVAVVDCARMFDEFNGGKALLSDDVEEDDVENLLIQQIEFCTTLVMNKADLVTPEQMAELRAIVRSLQRDARIVEAVRGEVALDEVLNTGRFSFQAAYESAAWAEAMEHPEEHEDPEVLEYDISTFVYRRRRPFDMARFSALVDAWPEGVVRCKGVLWRSDAPDGCFLFEQSGKHFYLTENGEFVAAYPEADRAAILAENPQLSAEWDVELGDRMNKLVFIGRHMDRAEVEQRLDACLAD
ncbi:GTP-binding protein [Adlercreutzia sp. ZJ242]|uniref:CobW family GTP-binding protein n=1 Tax=Adlercreutzia sp. ZJ242 TaxID=2709409 RepID=UPI0013EADF09|nr:GTP-binding protein [Adlercreutzia sp. ZJ242]